MSERAEHTLGPWVIMGEDTDEGGMPFIQIETKMDPICRVSPVWLPDETEDFQLTKQVWANAHLIAAAPDLLEAARAAKNLLIKKLEEPERTVFWKLAEAILKAEGREP